MDLVDEDEDDDDDDDDFDAEDDEFDAVRATWLGVTTGGSLGEVLAGAVALMVMNELPLKSELTRWRPLMSRASPEASLSALMASFI